MSKKGNELNSHARSENLMEANFLVKSRLQGQEEITIKNKETASEVIYRRYGHGSVCGITRDMIRDHRFGPRHLG